MEEYFSRNRLWITPFVVSVIILGVAAMTTMLQVRLPFPAGILYAALLVCGLLGGYGAIVTDTPSARLFRLAVLGLGLAAALIYFLR